MLHVLYERQALPKLLDTDVCYTTRLHTIYQKDIATNESHDCMHAQFVMILNGQHVDNQLKATMDSIMYSHFVDNDKLFRAKHTIFANCSVPG